MPRDGMRNGFGSVSFAMFRKDKHWVSEHPVPAILLPLGEEFCSDNIRTELYFTPNLPAAEADAPRQIRNLFAGGTLMRALGG
jgi:hypothetical protein